MSSRLKDDGKVSENISNVNPKLDKGSKVAIGDANITITDPYGIRNFAGREGKHSTGIDLVTSNGNAVAVADGVIVDVKAQYKGGILDVTSTDLNDPNQVQLYKSAAKTMKPTEGASAGFFVTVQHPDGTFGRYMHLDPIDPNSAKSLVGKQVKRGESLGSYSKSGSGSMTGKHVKFRVFTDLNNSSSSHVDPTNYLLGNTIPNQQPTDTRQTTSEFNVVEGIGKPKETYDQFIKELAVESQKEQKVETSEARQEIEGKKETLSRQEQFLQAFSNITSDSIVELPQSEVEQVQQMQRQQAQQPLELNVQTQMPQMPTLEEGGTLYFNTPEEYQQGLTGAPEGSTGIFNYPNAEERQFIRTDRDLTLFADGQEIGRLTKDNPTITVPPSKQIVEKEFQDGGEYVPKYQDGNPTYKATLDWLNANPYTVDGKPITLDKLQATTPTPGQYPKLIKDRIDISGIGSYHPGEYVPVQMPTDYQGLPIYQVNGKYISVDKEFNKEYLNYYKDEKLLGKDILYPIYGVGRPYKTNP